MGYVTIVSVRVDDEMLAEARRHGINVSEALRKGLEAEIRKRTMLQNIKSLAKHAVKPDTPSLQQIREMRDGHRF